MSSLDVPGLAELVTHDHRVIDGLLAALGTDRQDRFPLAHRLVDEVAAHLAAVTQVVLPALRDIVPGGAEMATGAQAQLGEMRAALTALGEGHPGDGPFEEALVSLGDGLQRHVPVEENEHLPALGTVIGAEAMAELGRVYAQIKENTPGGLDGLPATDRNPTFRTGG